MSWEDSVAFGGYCWVLQRSWGAYLSLCCRLNHCTVEGEKGHVNQNNSILSRIFLFHRILYLFHVFEVEVWAQEEENTEKPTLSAPPLVLRWKEHSCNVSGHRPDGNFFHKTLSCNCFKLWLWQEACTYDTTALQGNCCCTAQLFLLYCCSFLFSFWGGGILNSYYCKSLRNRTSTMQSYRLVICFVWELHVCICDTDALCNPGMLILWGTTGASWLSPAHHGCFRLNANFHIICRIKPRGTKRRRTFEVTLLAALGRLSWHAVRESLWLSFSCACLSSMPSACLGVTQQGREHPYRPNMYCQSDFTFTTVKSEQWGSDDRKKANLNHITDM